jgi:hypothetical protein
MLAKWRGFKIPAVFLATAGIGSLLSCGGGGTTSTPTSPVVTQPPTPVQTVVAQGSFSIDAPNDGIVQVQYSQFTTTRTGEVEATVDWTRTTNQLWMYIAEGVCTGEQFEIDECPGPDCPCKFSVSSEEAGPKPRVLKIPNASAGTRTLIVWNLGPKDDLGAYQVVLTASAASGAQAEASRTAGPTVATGYKTLPPRLRH